MPNIIRSAPIPTDADALWRDIGAFGAVGNWHPMLETVESEGDSPGAVRVAHAADGSTQVERLQYVDGTQHVYRYAMESSTSLPVRDYVGEFRVDDNGDGSSTVVWTANFEMSKGAEDDAVGMVSGFLEAGLNNLKKQYER